MIDAQGKLALQNLIRRESRSLLQYVSESFPWITGAEQAALARLQVIVQEERAATDVIARFLGRNRIVPPMLGPYPMTFTNINYIALEYLLPLLIDYQQRRIAALAADLNQMLDAGSRQQVEHYIALKRRHLQTLEEMLAELGRKPESAIIS